MSPKHYRTERKKRGTQKQVAALLNVARPTISHRERGTQRITREASLAIKQLPIFR